VAKDVPLIILASLALLIFALMLFGWYSRKRRQAHIGLPVAPPAGLADTDLRFTGKYVATTVAGDQLNRINVHGLGFRGNCLLEVHPDGIVVSRAGSPDLWLARSEVRGVSRATWTIDRVVENNGLQVIEWNLDGTAVDSYFRMDDPEPCERALDGVVGNERQSQ
tara:strand:- start:135811 stop:136305 length:495 start_codon:yes stop_codon:yes gene_type:complete